MVSRQKIGKNILPTLIFAVFVFGMFGRIHSLHGQSLQTGMPVIEEAIRRSQLLNSEMQGPSFALRPLPLALHRMDSSQAFTSLNLFISPNENFIRALPIRQTMEFNSKRPYGWGNGAMVPNVGLQSYTNLGVEAKFSVFNIKLSPELIWTENKSFQGFSFTQRNIAEARYRSWSFGDYPERYGESPTTLIWWGQSKFTLQAGFLEAGISTENIWWGPGQFSALTFSNNARSFPHLTLRTRRPAKTFLGQFEGEILSGKIEDSGLAPAQIAELNSLYFYPFSGDHKYVNAMTLTYNPKWVPTMFVGFTRTHQQYSDQMGDEFFDYLPIFEPFQKSVYGFDKDSEGRDQQFTFFGRYVIPKASMEVYFEYGRRDHAYNWREAILNPEHARAYLLGFQKVWKTGIEEEYVQVRAELLHQQESVNRYIRYAGLGGSYTWHTHGQARGFTNFGEALGTGPGVGSNVQTLEIAKVAGLNKRGVRLERLANNQDFFYRAFGQNTEKKPWIDLSVGLLWDQEWDRLILSGKFQYIRALNYQWQSEATSTVDFPDGQNLGSFFTQIHLIYRVGN